jgi:DNA-binding SARP family transcriptional activator/pimeloyl-ACP methyl ester carboxylesterase
MSLSVKLLGEFELQSGTGVRLTLPTRKTRALFAYLLANADTPQPRERLMDLLWSERGEQQARHSLNQALLAIRKLAAANDPPVLDSDSQHVTLRNDSVSTDLARFRELVVGDPAQAITFYSGPFLEGLTVPGPVFEEWLRATRAELLGTACNALHRAAEIAEGLGDTGEAIAFIRKLLGLDPLREDAHRRLIRMLYESGDRASALRQYVVCADTLKNELQVEPDADTQTLVKEIRSARSHSQGNEANTTTRAPETPISEVHFPLATHLTGSDSEGVTLSANTMNLSTGGYRLTAKNDEQEIRLCSAPDGTALAYAIVGNGPPLLRAPTFMTHLEHDWNSPALGPLFRAMAERYRFIRFDQRGNGLSDRNPTNISFELFVQDIETVADSVGLERFPIYGTSQGAAVAIAYASRHPERVSALILQGGYARGRFKRGQMSDDVRMTQEALITLIRTGWGQDNPAFRQMFSTLYMPGASSQHFDSFNELMRVATEPDIAARIFEMNANIDVTSLVSQVQAPALILHGRKDAAVPYEEGRRLAALIPDAKMVELDTVNHITLHDEPAMRRIISEIEKFLANHPAA